MIPKIIHYCWFGGNPYPEKVEKCIDSWKKMCPDFTLKRWDESNFDFDETIFTREAAAHEKWAFVSDYARLKALYNEGGFYLDTDIEIVKRFDDKILLSDHTILSLDGRGFISVVTATPPGRKMFRDLMHIYRQMTFIKPDGTLNLEVNNTYTQNYLRPLGYCQKDEFQFVDGYIELWPNEYFNARNLVTGELMRTENTYSIHWHFTLWATRRMRIIRFLRYRIFLPIMGEKLYLKFVNAIKGDRASL